MPLGGLPPPHLAYNPPRLLPTNVSSTLPSPPRFPSSEVRKRYISAASLSPPAWTPSVVLPSLQGEQKAIVWVWMPDPASLTMASFR